MECFITYLKDIEGRIDPNPYHPLRLNTIRKLKSSRYDLVPLSKVAKFRRQITETSGEDERYLGLENIESDTGILVQSSEDRESFGSAFRFTKGDILFPKLRPYLNKVHIAEFNGVCSTEFHVLQAMKCKAEYLFAYLNSRLVVNQTSCLMTGNTLPRLQTDDIVRILVPIPPPEIQNQVSVVMQSAYQLKKQKQAEAQSLLDSIDGYVLGELGIDIDYQPKLTFVTHASKIKERLDPLYHCQEIYYFLSDYTGGIAKLGDHIEYAQSGFAAGYGEQATEDNNGILQIRPTNISDDRRLVFDKNIYVKREAADKQPGDLLVKGEVLFNNTNSQELVGKSVSFNLDGQYFCSNHITRIKVKDTELDADYLTAILNLYQRRGLFYRICTNWNNQSGVNVELLKTVRLPLPSLEIQQKIASEIQQRMNKADELQKQAQAEIEKAKAEVERLILG